MALQSMSKNTKYIAFQDSDDFSHKERIRKQIENQMKKRIERLMNENKYDPNMNMKDPLHKEEPGN